MSKQSLKKYIETRASIRSLEFTNQSYSLDYSTSLLYKSIDKYSAKITDSDLASLNARDREIFKIELSNPTFKSNLWPLYLDGNVEAFDVELQNYFHFLKDYTYSELMNRVNNRIDVNVLDKIMNFFTTFKSSATPFDGPNEYLKLSEFLTYIADTCSKYNYTGKWMLGNANMTMKPYYNDIRIVVKYLETDKRKSITSWLHELGHGLAEQRLNPTYSDVFLSLPLHEAHAFGMQFYTGEPLSRIAVKSNKRVFNSPHYYNQQIAVRYLFEKEMHSNPRPAQKLLTEISNDILGHDTSLFADPHWAMGLIGYFTSYTVGHVMAAQLANANQLHGDLTLLDTMDELAYIEHVTGKPLSTDDFESHWG